MAVNNKGETALDIAKKNNAIEIIALMAIDNSKQTRLMKFVTENDLIASAIALFAVILLVLSICVIPFVAFVVVGLVAYKRYKSPMVRMEINSFIRESESHVVCGAYLGLMGVLALAFAFDVVPAVSSSIAVPIVLTSLEVAAAALYVACIGTNPGVLNKRELSQERLEEILDNGHYLGDLCPVCLVIKPARSKHCSHCGSCIAHYGKKKKKGI